MEMNDLYVQTLINTVNKVSEDIQNLTVELRDLTNNRTDAVEYEGKHFNVFQHDQIIKGLEQGVDVSLYSDPDYDDLKMAAIRLALSEHVPIKREDLTPSYNLSQLSQVLRSKRLSLNCPLLNPSMPADKMAIYITAVEMGVNITPYLDEFDSKRLELILNCLVNNYDVNKLAIAGLSYEQMEIVYYGLDRNLDVTQYNNSNLSKDEMINKYNELLRSEYETDYYLTYYCLPSDVTSFLTNQFKDISSAIAFREQHDGSIGVIYHFNDKVSGSELVVPYQLLNSYQELTASSIDDKLFFSHPGLRHDHDFLGNLKELVAYSKNNISDLTKRMWFSALPEYREISSIGGRKL